MTNAALDQEAEKDRGEVQIDEESAQRSADVLKRIFKLRKQQRE
jgi:hypothetical protein